MHAGTAQPVAISTTDRKSTRLNSSHTEIYTFPYTTLFRSRSEAGRAAQGPVREPLHRIADQHARGDRAAGGDQHDRSEEHTSELQSHRDLHFSLHDALPISERGGARRARAGKRAAPSHSRSACTRGPRSRWRSAR